MAETKHKKLTPSEEAQVDQLLHDAEHADAGAAFARMLVGRLASAKDDAEQLIAKRDALLAEANALDPQHSAACWSETETPTENDRET
jgi:hypothetical protein